MRKKFETYPAQVKEKLLFLRQLIFDTATETQAGEIEETLKWGEPSYLAQYGSTIRIDWKVKSSDHIAIYFNCRSRLIETIKLLYGDFFEYRTNRAIVFKLDQSLPIKEIKQCISMALHYKKVKHLPFLGA